MLCTAVKLATSIILQEYLISIDSLISRPVPCCCMIGNGLLWDRAKISRTKSNAFLYNIILHACTCTCTHCTE